MRVNTASMIYDKNKLFKLNFFSEDCIKLWSYENIHMVLVGGLNHNKRQGIFKMKRRHYYLQNRKEV